MRMRPYWKAQSGFGFASIAEVPVDDRATPADTPRARLALARNSSSRSADREGHAQNNASAQAANCGPLARCVARPIIAFEDSRRDSLEN
jgi:hypothetical protein